MKTRWFVMAALPVLAIPLAWAQVRGEADGSTGKLTRVTPPGETQDETERFDRDAWRKKLTAGDLAERESAFDEIAEVAQRDPTARAAIEGWSRDESDAGLAWTSRLVLREVERSPRRWIRGGSRPGWGLFGQDFDFDDFARRFDDLDSMFGDLRSQWDDMLQALPNPSALGGARTKSAESLTVQSGPDGVTCKITEKVEGQEEVREYSAKTMEELLEAHPELRSKLGGSGSHVWRFPNGSSPLLIPHRRGPSLAPRALRGGLSFRNELPGSIPGTTTTAPRTDRLGIHAAPVDESASAELGIPAGDGLRVEGTQPGTIASILGLRSGDVVLEINGTTIRSADDVKRVLSERAEGAEVAVVVVGSEGRRTLTWKPAAKKPDTGESKSGTRGH